MQGTILSGIVFSFPQTLCSVGGWLGLNPSTFFVLELLEASFVSHVFRNFYKTRICKAPFFVCWRSLLWVCFLFYLAAWVRRLVWGPNPHFLL